MISQVEFLITETFLSFRRHPAMAFAAITCVAAALFVSGLVGLGILNARYAVDTAMSRVRFNVFFHRETSREEAEAAVRRLRTMPGVETAMLRPKEVAWQELEKKDPEFTKQLGRNPLPDQVIVKATDLDDIPRLAARVESWPEVDSVRFVQQVSNTLENISKGVSRVGAIVGVILIVLSLVIIHHTIELTLYARRREIFIMSLVGATPTTIAMPFLMEGIVYGLVGSSVALGCVSSLYRFFVNGARANFSAELLQDPVLMFKGAMLLLAAGMALGFIGSLISVLKYLNRPRSKVTNA